MWQVTVPWLQELLRRWVRRQGAPRGVHRRARTYHCTRTTHQSSLGAPGHRLPGSAAAQEASANKCPCVAVPPTRLQPTGAQLETAMAAGSNPLLQRACSPLCGPGACGGAGEAHLQHVLDGLGNHAPLGAQLLNVLQRRGAAVCARPALGLASSVQDSCAEGLREAAGHLEHVHLLGGVEYIQQRAPLVLQAHSTLWSHFCCNSGSAFA